MWVVAALMIASPAAGQLKAKQKELLEIQKELEAARREIENYRRLEDSLGRDLGSLESRNAQSRRRLEQTRRSARLAEERKRELTQRLEALGQASGFWQERLTSEVNGYAATLAARNDVHGTRQLWAEAFRRAAIYEKVDLIAGLQGFSRKTALAEAQARARAREVERIRQRVLEEQRRTQKSLEEKKAAIAHAREKAAAAQARARELEENARALTRLISELSRRPRRPGERARWGVARHSLPWPVAGAVEKAFGRQKHPELDTWFIHQGLLLSAAPAAPVCAVEAGRVIFAGPFRSYGQVVIVDHGGGFFTIYGELGEVLKGKGAAVRAGEIVGTASQKDGRGQAYFEIRRGTEALDPQDWLTRTKR